MAKICIDAGHGGMDSGAVNGDRQEKNYALSIAIKLADKLEEKGHTVVMTREKDQALTLQKRCDMGNKCDYFVSVHLNAATNKNASGIETFMHKKADALLATNIQNWMLRLLPDEKNRGVKSSPFYVLKNTKVPSALVEVGFLSHDPTAEKFDEYCYQDRIAEAICHGILKTIG